jgi:hypothetical protein
MTGRDWTHIGRREFDRAALPVQEALFALPDPLGTPDMFDSEEDQ